jgi:hypothetical protein
MSIETISTPYKDLNSKANLTITARYENISVANLAKISTELGYPVEIATITFGSKKISGGVVHVLPVDLRLVLSHDSRARSIWESLTPLARNEWICWTVSVKQQKTRDDHVKRAVKELKEGVRRPCCWIGCIHRTDKVVSPSIKWILSKKTKTR